MARSGTPRARYPRHTRFERLRRSKVLPRFLAERADDLEDTGSDFTFTATAETNLLNITAHGLSIGEGPFIVTAATALPTGMLPDQLYWILAAPTANAVQLTSKRGSKEPVAFSTAGSGTLTLIKDDSEEAILEYLRQNPLEVVRDAESVDDL